MLARTARRFNELVIPRGLQRNLPFKDKPKKARGKVDKVQENRVAVVRSKKEKQVRVHDVITCQLVCHVRVTRFRVAGG